MGNVLDLARFALLNNEDITSVIAKTSEGYPLIDTDETVAGLYPQIELHQEYGNDLQNADDEIYTERSVIEVNYFCMAGSQYKDINPIIKQTLRKLGFTVVNSYSMVDKAIGVIKYCNHFQIGYTSDYIDRLYDIEQSRFTELQPTETVVDEEGNETTEPATEHGTFYDPITGEYFTV